MQVGTMIMKTLERMLQNSLGRGKSSPIPLPISLTEVTTDTTNTTDYN